jgi:hypothetical protein
VRGDMIPPDLTVPLPTAKDAIVNLKLPDGAGGLKHFKTHLGNLTRHSGFFATASRQGTELKVAPLGPPELAWGGNLTAVCMVLTWLVTTSSTGEFVTSHTDYT